MAEAEPVLAMMLAMDKNKLIGNNNAMPWYIPGELAYFKKVTMGKPVIMGRKTFDSLGKPLPGRLNIVVTRAEDWSAEGVQVAHSLSQALAMGKQNAIEQNLTEYFVIGGASLCREAIPQVQRCYLTYIDHEYEGDVWLDSFHWDQWREVSRTENQHEALRFTYLVLEPA